MAKKIKKNNKKVKVQKKRRKVSTRRKKTGRKQTGLARKKNYLLSALLIVFLASLVASFFFLLNTSEKRSYAAKITKRYLSRQYSISLVEFVKDFSELCFQKDFIDSTYLENKSSLIFADYPHFEKNIAGDLRILKNRAYHIIYNEELKIPIWAAYKLSYKENAKVPAKNDLVEPLSFEVDERSSSKLTSQAYNQSGFIRTFLASEKAIALKNDQEAFDECYLMTNVVPQKEELNNGVWQKLLNKEVNSYPARFEDVWIISGALFNSDTINTTPSGVAIPDAYYKIYVRQML